VSIVCHFWIDNRKTTCALTTYATNETTNQEDVVPLKNLPLTCYNASKEVDKNGGWDEE
jgi:hypothetical protein